MSESFDEKACRAEFENWAKESGINVDGDGVGPWSLQYNSVTTRLYCAGWLAASKLAWERDRWIPVTEATPDNIDSVLVTVSGDSSLDLVYEAWFEDNVWLYEVCERLPHRVIAWRPKPQPYHGSIADGTYIPDPDPAPDTTL